MYDKLKSEGPIKLDMGAELDAQAFKHRELEFTRERKKGMDMCTYYAGYKGMHIKYRPMVEGSTSGTLIIEGSIHKYSNWDGNRWNDSDFSLSQCRQAIEELSQIVGLNLKKAELRSLEFGVNLRGFDTMQVIESLQTRRNKPPFPMYDRGAKAYGKRFKYDQFELKLYDKVEDMRRGKIQIPDTSIYRIEYRATKMKPLNKIGVRTIGDTLDKDKFIAMGKKLAQAYGEINKAGTPVESVLMGLTDLQLFAVLSTLDLPEVGKATIREAARRHGSIAYMRRAGREVSKKVQNTAVHEEIKRGIIETVECLANG